MDIQVVLINGTRILIIGLVMALFFAVIGTSLQVLRMQVRSNGIKMSNILGIGAFLILTPIIVTFYPSVILGAVDQSIDNSKASADSITEKLTGWISEAFDAAPAGAGYIPNPDTGAGETWPTPIITIEDRGAAKLSPASTSQSGGGAPVSTYTPEGFKPEGSIYVTERAEIRLTGAAAIVATSTPTVDPESMNTAVPKSTVIPKVMTLQPTPTLQPTATPLGDLSDWQPGINPTPTN